jgi:dCTP deaminase
MILSGLEIVKQIALGNISIQPFNASQVNPNSYNLTLDNYLLVYKDGIIDSRKKELETYRIDIPETGVLLEPNKLYLGKTVEWTESNCFVPRIEGRSSLGRIGFESHICAGFGDVGFKGNWTLEIRVTQPTIIYPYMQVCQITFEEVKGDFESYNGKYQNQKDVIASKIANDFK